MLEAIASDVVDSYGNDFQINLVLNDVVQNPTASVEALLFWRWADEPTSDPQLLGTAIVGVPFIVPFDLQGGREIEVFAVAKTATGEQSAVNPLNGETARFLPNLETAAPILALAEATTNLLAKVNVSGYSSNAKYRRIKFSENSDMSAPVTTNQDATTYANGLLPSQLEFSKTSEASAVHRYVTVEHSSNGQEWGTASDIFDILYADSGGSGGGGGDTRAVITSADWDAVDTVTIVWTAASGSGDYTVNYRYRIYNEYLDRWGNWVTWSNLTSSNADLDYDATIIPDITEKEVQFRVKRTSQDDTLYSDTALVSIPGTG